MAGKLAFMVKRSSLDPLEEARARVKLRYAKAKPVHPGPPSLGKLALRLARQKLPSSSKPIDQLKDQWENLVGAQLAKLCRPEKISSVKGGRQLTLKVIPAAAGLVQHQSEMIRQRLSVAAGGDLVRLKLVQGPLTDASGKTPQAPPIPLTLEQRDALLQSAKTIEDDKLRAALISLGEAVLSAPE